MKLVSYLHEEEDRLGILVDDLVYPVAALDSALPDNMQDFLWGGEEAMTLAKTHEKRIRSAGADRTNALKYGDVKLLAPVPYPTSVRDAYAFRQHVETARANRGAKMIPEFDAFPVFYFTTHTAIEGPGPIVCMPDHFQKLDYELEVAAVINKMGRNIPAKAADEHIGGFMIMNDLSARQLQKEEMKLNLGPAKGKDFANIFGPWLVTPDELAKHLTAPKTGHTGKNYNLKMQASVNGQRLSDGNMADMDWTFAEIIERVSYGTDILPGDVIGSGTVGTGCLLEINGSGLRKDPSYEAQWLKEDDVVELDVTGLGKLRNVIKREDSAFSILSLKKNYPKG